VSEAVVGLTIVAGGTSLPELATSVVSARKGQSGIAIGNVLGSNVFNILMILGLTGIIAPMDVQGITLIDLSMMAVSMLLLWIFSYTKYTVARWEGAVLTIIFVGYLSWLVMSVV
jgi:cation:H+ antiporter